MLLHILLLPYPSCSICLPLPDAQLEMGPAEELDERHIQRPIACIPDYDDPTPLLHRFSDHNPY